jgi:hypothetical protein
VFRNERYIQHILLPGRQLHLTHLYFPPMCTSGDNGRTIFPVEKILATVCEEIGRCENESLIVAGDFNCRLDGQYNEKGIALVKHLSEIGVTLAFTPEVPTFVMSKDRGSSIVDLCFSNVLHWFGSAAIETSNLSDHRVVRSLLHFKRGCQIKKPHLQPDGLVR